MQELELKVELSKFDMDRLANGFATGDLSIGPARTKELRAVKLPNMLLSQGHGAIGCSLTHLRRC